MGQLMKHKDVARKSPRELQRQQGVVLYVALIVMVAMMLAGVAMLRSVGTGVGLAGNLAFKQNATLAGDRAADAAIAWMQSLPAATASTTLQSDDPTHRYFSSWDNSFNPLTFNWTAADTAATAPGAQPVVDSSGNTVRYVIHRLCLLPNASAQPGGGQQCAASPGTVVSGTSGPFSVGAIPSTLFRVTSRVDGPRSTLSYVQIVVY